MQTRRTLLRRGAAGAGGALALSPVASALAKPGRQAGYGPLVEDSAGVLDLPRGFRYRVVQSVEDQLSDGAPVPGDFDGMVAVAGPRHATILVRNHELRPNDTATKAPVAGRNPYDPAAPGGTTALLVGPDRKVERSYVSSSGTLNNCAGGGTPWGTWITCEEDRTTGHGYAFEVDPTEPENNLSKTPIRAMGFFSHEAVDIDSRTGIAYLTEDDFRGSQPAPELEVPGTTRSSFLYRYLPDNRAQRPGALQDGGRLQAMAIQARPLYNMDLGRTSERFVVVWVDVSAEEPHDDALAKGAARFQRLEGCHFAGGAFWFDDTSGGGARVGQVFRLIPSGDPGGGGTDTLELFLEGDGKDQMDAPDNLYITPWGDVWLAEDGGDGNRIVGITPQGESYVFAYNRLNDSEFAGPCFSPDGHTFFVNIQDPGHTFAIWGPFPRRNVGGPRAMASASPRHRWAPKVAGQLREQAAKHGMTPTEAAAYDRLGVTLA
ncbi:MAG TPA: alkaline phosphatase PhoX [Solirubrobacteraceae bacterium]|nr:alkaline phosphatase PhoX [Solirubrobacteraceae bacterium]